MTPIASTKPHFFVLTGGPGAGKTSLLLELEQLGHQIVREVPTDLITIGKARGEQEPWNKPCFNKRVVEVLEKRRRAAELSGKSVFVFDRCELDVIVYENLKLQPDQSLIRTIETIVESGIYQTTVFFIENLSHCEQTEVRTEDLAQSKALAEKLRDIYMSKKFNLISIPDASLDERANIIDQQIRHLLGRTVADIAA